MSTTLGEALSIYLTRNELGQEDAEAWSKIEVETEEGQVVLSWKDWAPGQTDDGTPHRVKLEKTLEEFMEEVWWI